MKGKVINSEVRDWFEALKHINKRVAFLSDTLVEYPHDESGLEEVATILSRLSNNAKKMLDKIKKRKLE